MMHTRTSTKLKDSFLRKYFKDFKIIGGSLMETFLGMEVKKDNKTSCILTTTSTRCSQKTRTTSRSRSKPSVPVSRGVILCQKDCPEVPDPRKQKFYRSFLGKLQFASWISFDIAFVLLQLHCSVLLQVQSTGQPFII